MQRVFHARAVSATRFPQSPTACRTTRLAQRCSKRTYADDASSEQTHPFQGYYADLLDAPLRSVQPGTRTAPAAPPKEELPRTEKEESLAKARVVFGSRLAGPVERRRAIEAKSHDVAGVMVPPRPDEPDNCCMSGCVNCVWDQYRDELEEWAAKSGEARAKLIEQRTRGEATGMMTQEVGMPKHVAVSMDDDGGGSESNWSAGGGMGSSRQTGGADLFADIPVGIREFMKIEKRLKEKHKKNGSLGG